MFYAKRLKRSFDLLAAVLGLILLAPVLAAAALAVWISLGSPVLFRQQRPGLEGRLFTILKFRTMRDQGAMSAAVLSDARRVTRVGRLLRSTSIDELPELWNVIKGEMSIVGPRPLLPQYLPRYSPRQARRHEVRPGITGWAQVNGRNAASWQQKFELDVWYVDNISLMVDATILWRTVIPVVLRRGINHPTAESVPEFMGDPLSASPPRVEGQ